MVFGSQDHMPAEYKPIYIIQDYMHFFYAIMMLKNKVFFKKKSLIFTLHQKL